MYIYIQTTQSFTFLQCHINTFQCFTLFDHKKYMAYTVLHYAVT